MSPESPKNPPEDDDVLDPVDLAAANWLVLHDRGLSSAQEGEFARWLRADQRHARRYAKLDQTWTLLDHVPAGRLPSPSLRRNWKQVWTFGTLAAAAAAALTFAFVTLSLPQQSAAPVVRSAVTPVGGFEKIDLPDGSVVRLNTASAVEVTYTATARRIDLTRGEANFVVAKDKSRPFIVRVGRVDVRAAGTIFNVRRHSEAVEVLVTEGKVRVDDAMSGKSLLVFETAPVSEAGSPHSSEAGRSTSGSQKSEDPLLAAGQRLTISTTARPVSPIASVVPIAPDEAARALAWQSRRVEFSSEPLENVVAEFNRYNRHQLVIGDARLGSKRFGGKFPAHDFESFILSLETSFGVVAERRENETVLRLRP
ncbi:MAG: FecR family protein [Opitutaceae bacterium]